MIELGELERHQEEFARRNAKVVVVSIEDQEHAQQTQRDFPHLLVISDPERKLANTVDLIHQHSAPGGGDSAAPTTILIDRQGTVQWLHRPPRAIDRLSATDLLAAVDAHLPR